MVMRDGEGGRTATVELSDGGGFQRWIFRRRLRWLLLGYRSQLSKSFAEDENISDEGNKRQIKTCVDKNT
nr:hypothetical protein Itr_chr13CG13370 [Ipomoea trifida]